MSKNIEIAKSNTEMLNYARVMAYILFFLKQHNL